MAEAQKAQGRRFRGVIDILPGGSIEVTPEGRLWVKECSVPPDTYCVFEMLGPDGSEPVPEDEP